MSLIILANRTSDVKTEVLNSLPKKLMLTSGEVDRWNKQCLTNFTVKGGREMKPWLGDGVWDKDEISLKV